MGLAANRLDGREELLYVLDARGRPGRRHGAGELVDQAEAI
jgi:hypothetical protein